MSYEKIESVEKKEKEPKTIEEWFSMRSYFDEVKLRTCIIDFCNIR